MNSNHRMPNHRGKNAKKHEDDDDKKKSKKLKKGGAGHHDDSDADSKGNLKGFIAYSDDSDESYNPSDSDEELESSDSESLPPRRAAVAARKKIKHDLKKEKESENTTTNKKKSGGKKKPVKVEESDEESESESESSEEDTPPRKVSSSKGGASAPANSIIKKKYKKRKTESSSDSSDFKDFAPDEYDDDDDDEEDDYDDDDEDYDSDDEDEHMGGGNLILTLGGGNEEPDRMVPQRYNMKKEPESVRKFVKLVTAPIEDNTIDAQIDQFKALSEEKQNELLLALEKRPTMTDKGINLMLRILTLKLPADVQAMILGKYNSLQGMDNSSGEYFKLRNWLDKVVSVPFGDYKEMPIKIEDGPEKCGDFMQKARKTLDDAVYGQEDTKLQILQYMSTKIANPTGRGMSLLLVGPPGIGKCHAKDTEILMADGTIKLVQDIIVGDKIMGDDSKPRQVLSLGRGKDMMYDIIPVKGEKFRVNSEHILCLKQSGRGAIKVIKGKEGNAYKTIRFNNITKKLSYKSFNSKDDAEKYLDSFTEEDNITEISVKDYLNLSDDIKDGWLKIYRKGVDFEYNCPEFDPYIIGLWLGDGSSSGTNITTQDAKVLTYLDKKLREYNLMLNHYSKYDYKIRSFTKGKNNNIMMNTLKKYNMINNKHIPDIYKINSRKVRLEVLAGLIDSDGTLAPSNTIQISQVSKQLTNDIIYLARSLGFAAYSKLKKTSWTYKGIKNYSNAYSILISGNLDEIPTKIDRKKAKSRMQVKDVLVTGITIKEVGYGDYYGFTLDGNHRYLLGDFTVTHNTSVIKNGIAKALDWPFQFISLGGDSDASTYNGHQLVYESSHCGKIVNSLVSAKSMSTIMLFDELDKVSTTAKGEEVQNLLVHLTDPAANGEFEDKYLAGIPIDLSHTMFVFSANDITKIDKVLLDRLMVIELKGYDLKQKIVIAENYLLPAALKEVNLVEKVAISKDILTYIIEEYTGKEEGVRELKRCIEQVTQKLNMLRMYNAKELPFHIKDFSLPFVVKKEHIDLFIKKKEKRNEPPMGMYN